ncbi:MAG: hypothetical protein JXX14_04070 [Deltaproteobacteria bacterium]|nr:hypothetical protein [Deltaproteobacteria bacterium]
MITGLKLRVVTPSGPVVELEADAITACSELGEFCVLPEHRPILAALKPGRFIVEVNGETRIYATDVGFFEGGADHVNVMTQHCVSKQSLADKVADLETERASLAESLGRLEEDSPARSTLESGLTWVDAQLAVVRESAL